MQDSKYTPSQAGCVCPLLSLHLCTLYVYACIVSTCVWDWAEGFSVALSCICYVCPIPGGGHLRKASQVATEWNSTLANRLAQQPLESTNTLLMWHGLIYFLLWSGFRKRAVVCYLVVSLYSPSRGLYFWRVKPPGNIFYPIKMDIGRSRKCCCVHKSLPRPPVCLQPQQRLTVQAFDAASWMKGRCNWLLLQTVPHPWQWQGRKIRNVLPPSF